MASQTFDNGELLLDVRQKINSNFLTVDQRVEALELTVASLPTEAYLKPVDGIPSTDLSPEVQSALTAGSTAFQKPVDGISSSDLALGVQEQLNKAELAYSVVENGVSVNELDALVVNTLAKADTAYQKPLTGIPKTDLSVSLQESVNKADTAVQPVDIVNGIDETEFVIFDTTPEVIPTTPGAMYWDSADQNQTLSIVMAGGTANLQVGQETYYRVKAQNTIRNGRVVMYAGAQGASGAILAKEATNIPYDQPHLILGIATQDIPAHSYGYVTWFGKIHGINTTGAQYGESWVEGDILYYDPTEVGGLTKVRPTVPNPIALMVVVVGVHSNQGTIFVRPQYGSTLGSSDGNVQFTTLADKDLISYNAVTGRWENFTPSQVRDRLSLGSAATQNVDSFTIKPSSSADPMSNGDMVFRLLSNTSLEIRVKGSDGVIRKATLGLA